MKLGPKKWDPAEWVLMPTKGAELGPVAPSWLRNRCWRERCSNAGEPRCEGLATPTSGRGVAGVIGMPMAVYIYIYVCVSEFVCLCVCSVCVLVSLCVCVCVCVCVLESLCMC